MGLFEADNAANECYTGDFGLWDVEWRIVFVVRNRHDAAILVGWAQSLAEDALVACGDDVALVPLNERTIAYDGACHHIAGVIFGVHA